MRAVAPSLAIALLLAGCGSADQPDAPEEAAATFTPAVVSAPETLQGEYRVAGVNGGEIDLPHGITASIGEDRIELASGCVHLRWTYTYEAGSLATVPVPVETCERSLLPEEEALDAAITAATAVRRTPENGVALSSGGHSATLFSQ